VTQICSFGVLRYAKRNRSVPEKAQMGEDGGLVNSLKKTIFIGLSFTNPPSGEDVF